MINKKILYLIVVIILSFSFLIKAQTADKQKNVTKSASANLEDGYIPTADGTRLFYQKIGKSKKVIILPGRLFAFEDFKQLADGWTLISYDMRGRGRSDAIPDEKKSQMLSIRHDVEDVETVRRYFGVEKFNLIGYSYLGLMSVMYAMDYPKRVERIVQLGPVPLKFGTSYPANLTNTDNLEDIGAKAEEIANVRKLSAEGYDKTNPQDYCEKFWSVTRFRLVGNPANVEKLGESQCDMPNEYPVNLFKHFDYSFASVQKLDIPKENLREIKIPVLTIHGTKDRNAPYGAGREWALLLPNARLLTIENAAHQSFAEYPDVVFPAVRQFLKGRFPKNSERVTQLNPNPVEEKADNQRSDCIFPFPKGKGWKLIL